MFCKSCGNEIPTGASACQVCGRPVETIVAVDEKKPESLASSAPVTSDAAKKIQKIKSDKLLLPLVLLITSGAGLVYLYISNTFISIWSWFTSTGEEKHLRPEINTGTDSVELIGNIGAIVISALFCILAIVGLVLLFKRLGRKFLPKR